MSKSVLDGTDLILSVGGKALGFSTGCKVTTSTETGERVTKEASSGKWKEKYVKSFSESISADGCVLTDGDTNTPTYDQLKDIQIAGQPVDVTYSLREGDTRTGKTTGGYTGKYIITSLELDGQAGDDAKYSVQLENSGEVKKIADSNGLSEASNEGGAAASNGGSTSTNSGSGSTGTGSDSGSTGTGSDSGSTGGSSDSGSTGTGSDSGSTGGSSIDDDDSPFKP